MGSTCRNFLCKSYDVRRWSNKNKCVGSSKGEGSSKFLNSAHQVQFGGFETSLPASSLLEFALTFHFAFYFIFTIWCYFLHFAHFPHAPFAHLLAIYFLLLHNFTIGCHLLHFTTSHIFWFFFFLTFHLPMRNPMPHVLTIYHYHAT